MKFTTYLIPLLAITASINVLAAPVQGSASSLVLDGQRRITERGDIISKLDADRQSIKERATTGNQIESKSPSVKDSKLGKLESQNLMERKTLESQKLADEGKPKLMKRKIYKRGESESKLVANDKLQ
ncbi:23906_t:CDS:2, partial [Gigaspora rosea]